MYAKKKFLENCLEEKSANWHSSTAGEERGKGMYQKHLQSYFYMTVCFIILHIYYCLMTNQYFSWHQKILCKNSGS